MRSKLQFLNDITFFGIRDSVFQSWLALKPVFLASKAPAAKLMHGKQVKFICKPTLLSIN
jgi:hypothetical protein